MDQIPPTSPGDTGDWIWGVAHALPLSSRAGLLAGSSCYITGLLQWRRPNRRLCVWAAACRVGVTKWVRRGVDPPKVTVLVSDKLGPELLTDYTGISCQEINLFCLFV